MRTFHFNLDRVLEWRARQLELEEAALQQLLAEKESLKARAAALEAEREAARRAVAQRGSATGQELGALDAFFRHVATERQKLAAAQTACERRIRTQRQQVIEARRRVKVIERLREKRLAEWRAGWDREQESLAGELFLARWKKRDRGT